MLHSDMLLPTLTRFVLFLLTQVISGRWVSVSYIMSFTSVRSYRLLPDYNSRMQKAISKVTKIDMGSGKVLLLGLR